MSALESVVDRPAAVSTDPGPCQLSPAGETATITARAVVLDDRVLVLGGRRAERVERCAWTAAARAGGLSVELRLAGGRRLRHRLDDQVEVLLPRPPASVIVDGLE